MDFNEIYNERVEKCSHETAFNREEALALYNLCYTIPACANIVEIGVEYGRSTTVIGSVAAERGKYFDFMAVDPEPKFANTYNLPVRVVKMTSKEAYDTYDNLVSLLHIDGDHSYEAVLLDCYMWLTRIRIGGYACFDDYGHPGLEGVKKAVDEYMNAYNDLFKFQGLYGNKLAVFRRLAYS